MKKFFCRLLMVSLFCGISAAAMGDVQVKLELEHTEYLQYETIQAFITIFNDEDYDVLIDSTRTNRTDALRFKIKRNSKEDAVLMNRVPLVDFIELKPGEKKSFMIDVTMWYSMSPVGPYDIEAELEYAGRKWVSRKKQIDVVDGIETATISRSIPGNPNRTRTYSLRYWNRGQKEYLFLRAEEKDSELIYGVFLLGSVVRVVKPSLEVDRDGNIVIVHQSGRNMFTRTTFKSELHSVKFLDQVYLDENGVPYNRQK